MSNPNETLAIVDLFDDVLKCIKKLQAAMHPQNTPQNRTKAWEECNQTRKILERKLAEIRESIKEHTRHD